MPGTFNWKKQGLSDANLRLAKRALLVAFYHPSLWPGKYDSCRAYFNLLVHIARVCDNHNILISELSRYPAIHSEVAQALPVRISMAATAILHQLKANADVLGFTIADERTIAFIASQQPEHEPVQSAYIPPRLWVYVVERLAACLDDFAQHKESIALAYQWIADARAFNAEHWHGCDSYISPFSSTDVESLKPRRSYHAGFEAFLKDYGLLGLFGRWVIHEQKITLSAFSKYLNLVRDAAQIYVLAFSIQRRSEAASLMTDCWQVERDERLGDVAMVVGETTKTDPDSDARWVVPGHVRRAVEAATFITRMRQRNLPPQQHDPDLPLPLFMVDIDGWSPSISRDATSTTLNVSTLIKNNPKLFNPIDIIVTAEDWKFAQALTPNLTKKPGMGIGLPWVLHAHQFRRTTAINMFASNSVSENTIQWLMKHKNREMTLYYGRHYGKVKLNSAAESLVLVEKYRSIYKQLSQAATDSIEHVQPHGREMMPSSIIQLVEADDEQALITLIKKGKAGCRKNLVGFCMRGGNCEYGGIESLAECVGTGTSNRGICADVKFARSKRADLIALKESYEAELSQLNPESRRAQALQREIDGVGVYLNVVR